MADPCGAVCISVGPLPQACVLSRGHDGPHRTAELAPVVAEDTRPLAPLARKAQLCTGCACEIDSQHNWFTAFCEERDKVLALRQQVAALTALLETVRENSCKNAADRDVALRRAEYAEVDRDSARAELAALREAALIALADIEQADSWIAHMGAVEALAALVRPTPEGQ